MADKNYKLIYEARQFQEDVYQAEAKVKAAQKDVDQAVNTFRAKCSILSGVPLADLQFSDSLCMADGIGRHVYHIKHHTQCGHHENKCIFCGCDNYEDLC